MKTSLAVVMLTLAGAAFAQQQPATQPQTPAASQPVAKPAAPQQKKEIKDPAEYNAYVSAIQQADPAAKISGLEAFLKQYPNSVMKVDALEVLMGAYEQSNDSAKMTDAANRVLQADPNNVRAYALLAYSYKTAQNWAAAKDNAVKGLAALPQLTKPDGVSDADFQKQKLQLSTLLNSVAGFSSLQLKDLAGAQKYLRASVEGNPNSLEDVYPLALAYLTATPPDSLNGIFFIARAANLAQGAGQTQITNYGKSVYTKYHGTADGWDQVLAAAKTTPLPPADFAITKYVPPTPADQAADLVKTKAPKDMSFAEWELVLSAGKPEDADKVWTEIKGKPLQMVANVISATPEKLELAGSEDDIEAKKADIELTMTGPIPARLMPKVDESLPFQGTPSSYTASPFMMQMEQGALLTQAKPKPPVHHHPATAQ